MITMRYDIFMSVQGNIQKFLYTFIGKKIRLGLDVMILQTNIDIYLP